MILTIGKKLGFSFGIILVLMIISAVVTYSLIDDNEEIQDQVINLRMKTVLLGKDVINGVNQSLAGLRGYIILGNDPKKALAMKEARKSAWIAIEKAIKEFDILAKSWTDPTNVKHLQDIKLALEAFKIAQQEIESISHTDRNIASYQLLLTDAAPRADQMLTHITNIIDEESFLEATTARKSLLKNLADIRGSFAVGTANIRAYLLSGEDVFKNKFEAKWQINQQRVDTINENQVLLFTPSQNKSWTEFINVRNEFIDLPAQMFNLRSRDDWNTANYWLGTKAAPRAIEILSSLERMKNSQDQLLKNDIEKEANLVETLKSTLIFITLVSLLLGIICSVIFSRNLLTRLDNILTRAKSIAEGDMSGEVLKVKGNDELSDLTKAINQMSGSLLQLVKKTADSMAEASKGTTKILIANQTMASGVNDQTAQIEQIATAIEELSNSSLEVANNCVDASDSSSAALRLVKSGGAIVKETLVQMVSIKDAFNSSSSAITSLSTQSKEIEDILSVIKSIADQTNLLALNAAIEAARAGEQGRGFAVVADEVRQLAKRTTDATAEVEEAVESIRRETEQAVTMMADGGTKVERGVDMTNEAASSLNNIIGSVDIMVEKIQAIAATAEEQSMTIAEVAKNTENVSTVSQQVESGISNVVSLSTNVTQETESKAKELLAMV
ncbi:HAMP domain-containing methyl-accepting chemotaxis protein [Cognaticolwellia mytili]|uniref:HAMP domain-containing methyl-accepting chemotaxis protein n=1 Tax=Cognaticolwellia mytili TaxID=1888913 RepID=UPI000A173D5E|nr:methyl-accepting chemotaxis protein [Cognaticolwellia mytili]